MGSRRVTVYAGQAYSWQQRIDQAVKEKTGKNKKGNNQEITENRREILFVIHIKSRPASLIHKQAGRCVVVVQHMEFSRGIHAIDWRQDLGNSGLELVEKLCRKRGKGSLFWWLLLFPIKQLTPIQRDRERGQSVPMQRYP